MTGFENIERKVSDYESRYLQKHRCRSTKPKEKDFEDKIERFMIVLNSFWKDVKKATIPKETGFENKIEQSTIVLRAFCKDFENVLSLKRRVLEI